MWHQKNERILRKYEEDEQTKKVSGEKSGIGV